MRNLFFLITFFSLISTSCAFAPFISTKTARSLDKGQVEIDISAFPTIGVSAGYGFSEKWDAGVILETQLVTVIGPWAKYSFINEPEGFAFAAYGGAFVGNGLQDASGFYLGPIVSYKYRWFEGYSMLKYNFVQWDSRELTSKDSSGTVLDGASFPSEKFQYVELIFGGTGWLSPKFGINLNFRKIQFTSFSSASSPFYPGAGVLFHF